MQKNKTRLPAGRQGFTLIELMIVMVILAILAAVGTSSFISSQKKSRDSTRKSSLKNIATALELYYNDKGKYPGDDGAGKIKGCGDDIAPTVCQPGTAFSDANGTIYMERLPVDPTSKRRYYYRAPSVNQFQIYANLENDQDSSIISTDSSCAASTGSFPCNFGLSSANITP